MSTPHNFLSTFLLSLIIFFVNFLLRERERENLRICLRKVSMQMGVTVNSAGLGQCPALSRSLLLTNGNAMLSERLRVAVRARSLRLPPSPNTLIMYGSQLLALG